jgi:aminopeptidase-like protein
MDNQQSSCIGEQIHSLIAELYPICRSITGNGTRETLARLKQELALEVFEVPSGTQVFDWTIPKEWNINDAYIKNLDGVRVVDFQESNLHVLNYSSPIHEIISLEKLKDHLYTLPEHPDWIPYRTSYYSEKWGFCLSHRQFESLRDECYEVCINSTLTEGSLAYAECYLPGRLEDEVLISCHICHPSLCNDNLSGISVATFLAKDLAAQHRRYSYRFLFIPGTIGAITWLAKNKDRVYKVKHGLVLTTIGDCHPFTYKRSRRGDAEIDRIVEYLLREKNEPHRIEEFTPYGYDERQFCSPGFNLPVGVLTRSFYGRVPEYHTSADNLGFVKPEQLEAALNLCKETVSAIERNRRYVNQLPFCEPQLGKRGLYRSTGGTDPEVENMARLWVLSLSDGTQSLLDISERSRIQFSTICNVAETLAEADLLREHLSERTPRATSVFGVSV